MTAKNDSTTYTGAAPAYPASDVTVTGPNNLSKGDGTLSYTYNGSATAPTTAGSYTVVVTFTPNDTTDYNSATGTATWTINPAPLTVTANNATRPYGAANPALSATITGFVHGEDSSVVSGSASLSTAATPTSPVGTYTITAAQGTLSAANYKFTTFQGGTLTVVPAVQSLAASPVAFQNLDTGSVPLATFNDAAGTANTYAATINWNDGSALSNGTLATTTTNNVIAITASGHHSYASGGAMYPTVTLTANGNAALSAAATPTVNVANDVSGLVTASSSGLGYNRSTKLYTGTLTVKNTSGGALTSTGYFRVVLSGLSSKITLASASSGSPPPTFGYDAAADLYISLPLTQLAAGASAVIGVAFSDAAGAAFNYQIKTYADKFGNPQNAQVGEGGGAAVYSPAQVRTAYGINNLSLDGTGQTIAIVDAYDNPAIFQAVDAFDAQFGVASSGPTLDQLYGPAASFLTVLNQRRRPDFAARRPTRPGPATTTGRWRRRSTWNGCTPSPRCADRPRRGRQPVAVRPDGGRGDGGRSARRVGGVDELGLPGRPGRARRGRGDLRRRTSPRRPGTRA